jgi:hypothetical protein
MAQTAGVQTGTVTATDGTTYAYRSVTASSTPVQSQPRDALAKAQLSTSDCTPDLESGCVFASLAPTGTGVAFKGLDAELVHGDDPSELYAVPERFYALERQPGLPANN